MIGRRDFHRAALAVLAAPLLAAAQRTPIESPHRALYMHQGSDRDALLASEGRKQGRGMIYTSLNLKDSVPLADAFEKKTGVKAQLWPPSSQNVLQKGISGGRAGHFAP